MARDPERKALLVVLLLALVLVVLLLRPLAEAIFLAGVLAAALAPAYRFLLRRVRGRHWIAGGLTVVGVLVLVLAPLVSLTVYVANEAVDAVRHVRATIQSDGVEGLVTELPDPIERAARWVIARLPGEGIAETLQRQATAGGGAAAAAVGSVVSATGSFLFQAIMMLIALYFLLTEKDRALDFIDQSSPLGKDRTRELMREFRDVTVAVLQSTVLTAAAQAVVAVIGYLIAGAAQPVFFGALTFFVALIPAVGAAAVVLLVAALQFFTGNTGMAIFLALWGVLVVGLVDNLLKPILIRGGVPIHGAVIFFSLIGGLAAFGAIGLILGPLLISLLLALLRIYRRDFGPPGAEAA